MKSPALVTAIRPDPWPVRIALATPLYSVGSCFAELMAERLRRYLFPVIVNPHGVVYNPVCAGRMLDSTWREPELFLHDGLWRSLNHHSSLGWGSRSQTLQLLANGERLKTHALEESRWLLLTLGTAQAFSLAGSDEIVANCHRLPQSLFQRRRLSVEESLSALREPLFAWLDADPGRQAVLTVSPVRYLRDGMVDNNRGKAVLLLVCESLEKEHPRISYFPAYEIVLDELRSYRYFERDMVHPNSLAADVVWQRFAETYLDPASLCALPEMDKLLAALDHRPGPLSDLKALGRRGLERLSALEKRYPELQSQQWRESFTAMLSRKTQFTPPTRG